MTIEILMPVLSPSMSEGALTSWQKSVGDQIKIGDVIAEIETDKATLEYEATQEGILGKILVEAGQDNIAVNQPIALMLEADEDLAALNLLTPKFDQSEDPTDEKKRASFQQSMPASSEDQNKPRVFASPLARRMAEQSGLKLSGIEGRGPYGRIVKLDIEAASNAQIDQNATKVGMDTSLSLSTSSGPIDTSDYEDIPLSSMRKTIARRLTEAKRDIPHFYLTSECRIDRLLALREELNDKKEANYRISVNDFIVRASALSLRKVPAVNSSWADQTIRQFLKVDVCVAVATEKGLFTPIIRNADCKGLAEISNELKKLAALAREGKLSPEQYQGGGFSISNLGMFGVKEFSAIINPPQACILAVGAGEKRAVVLNEELAIATVMTCTMSVDHRVVDGSVAAKFLAEFKQYVEDPMTMLL